MAEYGMAADTQSVDRNGSGMARGCGAKEE